MADVSSLIEYYTDLLIIQYNQKPKARATIQLYVENLLASGVLLDVLNGYDIETAVGKQLDVLGKYVGVDRFFLESDIINYFAFTDYEEPDPDSETKYGFSTYATYDGFSANGWLTYSDIVLQKNTLDDADFRTVIKLAIIQNTSNHSVGDIDTRIAALFGSDVHAEAKNSVPMVMWYFIRLSNSPLMQAILYKKLLPKPMGVRLQYVQQPTGNIFAFARYSNPNPSFAYGLSTYANYGSLSGQILTYDQISNA